MTEVAGGPEAASVASHFVRLLTDHAVAQGLPAADLLRATGLADFPLDDNERRLPFSDFRHLCDCASELLHDPDLGLHAGASVRPGHLGSHGYVLMSCSNGRELLERSLRYSSLVIDACRNEVEERDGLCIRYWRSNLPGGAPAGRIQDDMNMAVWISMARWVGARPDHRPSWVSFRHAEPADTSEYQRLFGCPLIFDAADTAVAFPASLLDQPLPQGNAAVRQMLDALCERLLAQLADQAEPSWLGACRRAISQALQQGVPEPVQVAASLDLSEAELRQRLASRGLSFRALVDDLRQQLGLGYIRDPGLSLVDIAYLLGFSEQSAFQRAFKRWTGRTPGEYRREST